MSIKRLGIAAFLNPRAVCKRKVHKSRQSKHRTRLGLLSKLTKTTRSVAKVYRTGLVPGLSYGSETQGWKTSELHKVTSECLRLHGLVQPGANTKLAAAIQPAGMDPAIRISFGAVARWHREVWLSLNGGLPEDGLTRRELGLASALVKKQLDQLAIGKAAEASAIGTLAASLHRVGWELAKPSVVQRRDDQLDLDAGTPARLRTLYAMDWQQCKAREAIAHKLDQHPELEPPHDIDLHDLSQLLRSRSKKGIYGKARNRLTCAFADGVMTMHRLRARGHSNCNDMDVTCPLCKGEVDHAAHRVWQCPATKHIREKFLKQKKINELVATKSHCELNNLWFPKIARARVIEEVTMRGFRNGIEVGIENMPQLPQGHEVFTDGSAMDAQDPALARAASAVAFWFEGAQWCLAMTLSDDMPQTAATAEVVAVFLALKFASQGCTLTIVTDCSSVVKHLRRGHMWATAPGRTQGGLWKMVDWKLVGSVHKIAAHKTQEVAQAEGWGPWWTQNDQADRMAKAMVRAGQAAEDAMDEVRACRQLRRRIMQMVGHCLAEFPTFKDIHQERGAPTIDRVKMAKVGLHHQWQWDQVSSCWSCSRCLQQAASRKTSRCRDLPQALLAKVRVATEQGHKLHMFSVHTSLSSSAKPLVACVRCGMYLFGQIRGLARSCEPDKSSQLQRLRRLRQGRHPTIKGVHVGHRHPLSAWMCEQRWGQNVGMHCFQRVQLHGKHSQQQPCSQHEPQQASQEQATASDRSKASRACPSHHELHVHRHDDMEHSVHGSHAVQRVWLRHSAEQVQRGQVQQGGNLDDPEGDIVSESD